MATRYEIYTAQPGDLDENGDGVFDLLTESSDVGDVLVVVHSALQRGEAVEVLPKEPLT